MKKRTYKIIFSVILCLALLFTTSINAFAAITSTYYNYFMNGSTGYSAFRTYMSNNVANLKNTKTTVASLDTYADYVSATSYSFEAPNDMLGSNNTCSYTIQGLCYNTIGSTTYVMISAYNNASGESVIFLKAEGGTEYTKITVSGETSHFGGIASTGSYTYIACTDHIIRISDTAIANSLNNSTAISNNNITSKTSISSYITIALSSSVTNLKASFLAYETATGLLWIGGNSSSASSAVMYAITGSTVDAYTSNTTLSTYSYKMSIPVYAQGASFRDGKVMITSSNGRAPDYGTSKGYISEIYCYSSYTKNSTSKVATLGTLSRSYMLPTMAEGVYMGATYTYIVYESTSSLYYSPSYKILPCKYVLASKTSSMFQ